MASVCGERVQGTRTTVSNRRGYDEPLWRNNNGRSTGQGGTAAIGFDINQIPHIDRHNVFPMSYEKTKCSARDPIIDVRWLRPRTNSPLITTQRSYLAHTSWQTELKPWDADKSGRLRLPLKWLSWTMADPVCARDGAVQQEGTAITKKTVKTINNAKL
ncbi:hypothetical protein EVAR_91737_1 [Eumeta japonica]|uniref:Uncharacterized protein n=1 Tax=Eumeta variegata TaxID=151549 RepID=A0A4C1ST30_EUMVA|nr:hypothetical protein EVAR_91737_1 [Eumeta japonica]